MESKLAAISVQDGDQHLQELDGAMQKARLEPDQRKRILVRHGKLPSREPRRTGWCPWTRRTAWPSTPDTSE